MVLVNHKGLGCWQHVRKDRGDRLGQRSRFAEGKEEGEENKSNETDI